jgi:hypothetical protein
MKYNTAIDNNIQVNSHRMHDLEGKLIITLTSYPKRFENLHLVLETLLNQSLKQDITILWLYEKDFDVLPKSVINLIKSGLDIRLVPEDFK